MMDRRAFLGIFALLAAPRAAAAKQAEKVWRIGYLTGLPRGSPRAVPLLEGLRELGYVEGRNLVIEWRYSDGRAERFPDLAAELVRAKVDVILAGDNPAIAAAQKATKTIPIVMTAAMDPVASGFASSLARPGSNLTGLSAQATDLHAKALQLLKEAVPTAARIAILWVPIEPGRQHQAQQAERAAHTLGLKAQMVEVRDPGELEGVFAAMVRDRVDAVVVHPSQLTYTHRTRIANLAARRRLPSMGGVRWLPEVGGLMSYSGSDSDRLRRTAYYVDRILRGANPADLPIEQPTRFELVINLKTAKALGLTIPPSLLARADQVIE